MGEIRPKKCEPRELTKDQLQPDTSAIEAMLTKVTPHLHPSQLQFSNGAVGRPKALVNGGWGDARDVALCKAFGKGQQLDAYTADAGR